MIFQERKRKEGYHYKLEDIFGDVDISSPIKLDAETLDELVLLLLRQNLNAGEIRGEVTHAKGTVKYAFRPRATWEDDDDENVCNDTPTSTKRPASASTRTLRLRDVVFNWCKRFVAARLPSFKNVAGKPPNR